MECVYYFPLTVFVFPRAEILPISKKIIDISKRLDCDETADSNENTTIELYKDGIIVADSQHGIRVSR